MKERGDVLLLACLASLNQEYLPYKIQNIETDRSGQTMHSQIRPRVIKLFSCSTQLSMNFFLLISVKIPTIVGILTFMSGKNSILGLPEPKNLFIHCFGNNYMYFICIFMTDDVYEIYLAFSNTAL